MVGRKRLTWVHFTVTAESDLTPMSLSPTYTQPNMPLYPSPTIPLIFNSGFKFWFQILVSITGFNFLVICVSILVSKTSLKLVSKSTFIFWFQTLLLKTNFEFWFQCLVLVLGSDRRREVRSFTQTPWRSFYANTIRWSLDSGIVSLWYSYGTYRLEYTCCFVREIFWWSTTGKTRETLDKEQLKKNIY